MKSEFRTVLIVSGRFPPSGGVGVFRALRMVRHLPEWGWKASVLAVDPDTAPWARERDPALLNRVPRGTPVRYLISRDLALRRRARAKTPSGSPPLRLAADSAARLVYAAASPDPSALTFISAPLGERPDAVWSTGPPHSAHIIGMRWRMRGVPWFMDYRDPFTGYVDTTSLIKRWLDRRIENLFLRRADGVTAVCESLGSDILRVAPFLAGRVHVIRNAPDWEHGKGPAASRGHDRRHMIVAHVGSLTRVRDPRPFLDGVALALKGGALDRARFRLRLVGFVTKEWSLPALLEERGLGDVTQATGFVPQAQAIEELRSADLAVLIGASVAEWNGRVRPVPVKLYEYLAAGTAILACDDGAEVGEILRQHGCDRIVGSRDPAGVANGLANAFADWQGGRLARPRAPTEPEFDPREQARRLALVLDGQRAGGA